MKSETKKTIDKLLEEERKLRKEHWNKIIKLKPRFDKERARSYQHGLKFWDEELIPVANQNPIELLRNPLTVTYYLDETDKIPDTLEHDLKEFFFDRNLPIEEFVKAENILTIVPSNEEENFHFNIWYLKHYSDLYYNIDHQIERVEDTLGKSLNPKKYLQVEIERLETPPKRKLRNDEKRNKIYSDYELRGKIPDWHIENNETVTLFAQAKFKIELLIYLKKRLTEYELQREETETTELQIQKSGIKNWNLRTRYYLAEKLGLLETAYFKGNSIGVRERHKLVANLLNCHPDNIKKIVNQKDRITEEEKKEVDVYLGILK